MDDVSLGRVPRALLGTIRRPNATFGIISGSPDRYLASAAAIFAASYLASLLPLAGGTGYAGGPDAGALLALSLASDALEKFLAIAVVFWIGRRLGGNREFKRTFSVLSYCLVPLLLSAAVVPAGTDLAAQALPVAVTGGVTLDPDLSPSFAPDLVPVVHNALAVFFIAWFLVLLVKAIKITNGFGTPKSVGIAALSALASYATMVALGTLTSSTLLFLQAGGA